ncbi:spore germination protein KB [Clostridium acidisoli DSM 12555]|uniref:Spore germination protein KB n=1 Tax=Clostridium acidisoli DSM 12555 TaxID=1121291 RepID=A0A1W1XR42_9CLOT|nr:GerAB/ArcD/ProY family transporter [Clostridium acidisoli]SMC26433.1 spore germination protein KB [Clostridium acidisoli DSM 12555]
MIRLSKHQLFTLMFVFEVGSTTIFALGIDAKQDAWIVILLALLIGLGFTWIYTELQNAFPDKNYVEMIIIILGKKLGVPFVLLNLLGYFWHCARNLREFGELIIITTLPKTSIWIVSFIFVLVSIYTLLKGVEVLARASEIIMPIILLFIISVYILLYISGNVDFTRLTPVLGNGIKPVLKTLPQIVVFPFGELFVFLMYWNYANEKNIIRKTAMKTVLWSGILLCFSLIIYITVLGDKYSAIATIPLIEVIRLVNIGDIITNIDSIGVIIIFLGGFFKMSIYLNAIALSLTTLFKNINYKIILILVGACLLWFSIIFEPSYAFHQWMFPFDVHYFGIVYTNIAPLLLLMIYILKKKRTQL